MEITFNALAYKAQYHDMAKIEAGKELPWIWMFEAKDEMQIGTAVVTVTLFPKEERHAKELSSLNAKLQEVRAENQQRENAILDQISKLQALTHEA